jgi:large subunit ribosomal protein L10
MPLLKHEKLELAKRYQQDMAQVKNVVVVSMQGIPVNQLNSARMQVSDVQWSLVVVKKRVFLKSLPSAYDTVTIDTLRWSIILLYSANEEDEHAPLKALQKLSKQWKKDKAPYSLEYVGAWYWTSWKDWAFVTELAELPSTPELVGKLLFMLNHPMSSFARALKAIADKSTESV